MVCAIMSPRRAAHLPRWADKLMRTVSDLVEVFRVAAIEKGDFAEPPERDHELHARMRSALSELQEWGASGHAALRQMLLDISPHVRCWVAAELLSRGDIEGRQTLEKLAATPGLPGFAASKTLEEFHGGRLRSPFGYGPWRLVVCAGAAGGLVDQVAIGDVVVATETVEHDIRKVGRSLVPRFPGAAFALDRCRGTTWSDGCRVHFGAIASGDEDVASEVRRAECHRLTGALAVAWEGAGGARACAFSEVPYLEVRAVADQANEHGPRDFATNLAKAMRHLAEVLRVIAK